MKNTIPGEQGLNFEEDKRIGRHSPYFGRRYRFLEQSLELYKRGIILIEFAINN